MTKNMNIALLSDVPPDSRYTAGQVLRKTLENTDFIAVDFYWLNQSLLPSEESLPSNSSLVFHGNFAYGKVKHALRVGLERLFGWIPKVRSLLIVSFALIHPCYLGLRLGLKLRYSRADVLWMVLQGERLAITYWIISKLADKPIILQQWDPMSWWLNHRGYPNWLSSRIEKLVESLEARAKLNLVPSHAWQSALVSKGRSAHRIDNFFLDNEPKQTLLVRAMSLGQLNAVFLGQLYSNRELTLILGDLSRYCRLNGLEFVLHYFGSSIDGFKCDGVRIENHGHVDRESLLARIAKWDAAILPYPTERRFEDASRLSFPSKARVYIAAGLPIISLSALDSSPHQFLSRCYRENYFNIVEGGDLPKFINYCREDTLEGMRRRRASGKKVIEDHFSSGVELAPFHKFLRSLK